MPALVLGVDCFLMVSFNRGVGGFAGEIGHCTFMSETFQKPPCHWRKKRMLGNIRKSIFGY
jgi:hypothetical protein